MSGTCIVCLGDLAEGSSDQLALSSASAKSSIPVDDTDRVKTPVGAGPGDVPSPQSELIARLKPCDHHLHNACLTPWVERANSCPICRAKFSVVELSDRVGGAFISSYSVEDRSQVAEFDPSVFLEEVDDVDDTGPCQICHEGDNEDVLMYCDDCNKTYHTYCVDLQEVPLGHWFCETCRAQREVNPRHPCPPSRGRSRPRPLNRRTRGQRRRFGSQDQAPDESWTQVWQTVWDRLHLDLDFPDDEEAAATAIRRHRQRNDSNRREHEAWQLRRRIAELQGGGNNRFPDTEPSLLHQRNSSAVRLIRNQTIRTRHHPGTPEQEPVENRLAWEAFDQARQEESSATRPPTPHARKRKSNSNSPKEPSTDRSGTRAKRPRTMQAQELEETSDSTESSRLQRPVPRRIATRLSPLVGSVVTDVISSGPSFLQSLLKEVEDSSAPNTSRGAGLYHQSPLNASSPVSDYQSPQPTSSALSPCPSTHSSPRPLSATPPPTYLRPESPTGGPWRPRSNGSHSDFSPSWSLPEPPANPSRARKSRIPVGVDLAAQRIQQSSPPPSRSRSSESSPCRQQLSFDTKSDVQKMVSTALRPHYRRQDISREEYTTINRDISRKLYDRIGDFEALGVEGRARWEGFAGDEVERAVSRLKAAPSEDQT